MHILFIDDFADWRMQARKLLSNQVSPEQVKLMETTAQQCLFAGEPAPVGTAGGESSSFTVPREFVTLAKDVALHRDEVRWDVLYRVLWRLTHGEPNLLEISTDDDIVRVDRMQKQVSRDTHKAKAFIRFRKLVREGEDFFVAWHQPDHRIVSKVAPFFSRRFKGMNWTIMTPYESATWDQETLRYHEGVPRSEAPAFDELESLWKTYYASIFNPARVKTRMMKQEMPVRYWKTMPETELIDDLLHSASHRVEAMVAHSEGYQATAAEQIENLPEDGFQIENLRELATSCRVCDLFRDATQTVFGEGNPKASIVVVGEQPGDTEDQAGKPFVGPAGQLLREIMSEAGLSTGDVYLTNVVKHFKHKLTQTPRGKKRIHQKPNSREIRCCRPWLEAELQVIAPQVVICLGVTAAQAIFGRQFSMTQHRGQVHATDLCSKTVATWHPAAILRAPCQERGDQMSAELRADLDLAIKLQEGSE